MKIFAVGMNYAEHNKELHGTLYKTEAPVIFTKPDSSLLTGGRPLFVPDHLGRIDYEAEVVVRICRLGKSIAERFAYRYYDAVTLGIDFTARDLQREAQRKGEPWTLCKGFDGAAAIGEWIPVDELRGIQDTRFRLDITSAEDYAAGKGGRTVQEGWTGNMLRGVDELISYLSQFFTLKTGDLLYTGTPAGVGPVAIGDHLEGWIDGRRVLSMNCK